MPLGPPAGRRRPPLVDVPPTGLEPGRVRQVTDEVLARPEFRENAPGIVSQLRAFVEEWLGRILEAVVGAGRGQLVGTLVTIAFVVVAVVLVARFAARVRRDPSRDVALAAGTGRAPREWLAEAEGHERAGRWRDAVRCRYRLLLARLAARGLLDEVPGRTSGEYLREATANLPAARDDLRLATRAFEDVWYGDRTPDAEVARGVAEAVDRVEAVAAGARSPALTAAGDA